MEILHVPQTAKYIEFPSNLLHFNFAAIRALLGQRVFGARNRLTLQWVWFATLHFP
jgi:hypothetical protein